MQKTIRLLPLLFAAVSLVAVGQQKRASPHETTSGTIGAKKVTIVYGRPYKKGRVIFGGLVPWNKVWRTGADEATTFTTKGDLKVGSLSVPKGTYGLFTIPTENGWTLVLNKTAKQWGAFDYDQSADLGRTPMKVSSAAEPVEQFTITFQDQGNGQGLLKMAWDKTVASVDVSAN